MITPNEIQYRRITRSIADILDVSESVVESAMHLLLLHIVEEARLSAKKGKSEVTIHIPKVCNITINIKESKVREDTHQYSVSVIQTFRDLVRDGIDHEDSLIRTEIEDNLDELLTNKILESIKPKYTPDGSLDISDL